MRKTNISIILSSLTAVVCLLAFQNCSDVRFENLPVNESLTTACVDEDCIEIDVTESTQKALTDAPHDILFVIDDSVSMRPIIEKVKAGFASLGGVAFSPSTKMAVTYMSVAKYNENGSINFDVPFIESEKVKNTPGYLSLVSSATIRNYLEKSSDKNTKNFISLGCDSEWFSPTETNAAGERCLDAAVQTPLYSTGVEAGLVSIEQLIAKYNQNKKQLFRSKAVVHIIFITDTHEPGLEYWGLPGALAKQRNLGELQDIITANSPDVSSIKFSGVLPLPFQGSPYLDPSLRVLGNIPATELDAVLTNENYSKKANIFSWYDYSYLPFIIGTGGLAIHPVSDDWTALADKLKDETYYTGSVIIPLKKKLKSLTSVTINNESFDLSLVELSSDRMSIRIQFAKHITQNLNIELKYTSGGN